MRMLPLLDPSRIWGVDVNATAVERARHNAPGTNVIRSPARDLPFRDGFVDLVYTVGVLIHQPDETLPQYRRIKINRPHPWVRVAYQKPNPIFTSLYDHIPLRSRVGFLLGMRARKLYQDRQVAEAHAYEADAARLELEAQLKIEPPTHMPPQFIDRNSSLRDRTEYDIR
jgi:ubiquinone/menaquinone biosynthesis C-methylase UbiE